MEEVDVGLVEVDPFPDDALAILVQGKAAAVEETRPFEITCFGFEHVVMSVPVLVDPSADAVAGEGGLNGCRPRPSVGKNSSMTVVNMINENVGGLGQHRDL